MTFSLTCFIRSKSKASIATSLLLLTGFILEKWKKSIKKPVSSLQCVLSCTHLMVWMKSTPEQQHLCSSAGQEAPYCAAQEHLAAREQHCSWMRNLTLKDAVKLFFLNFFSWCWEPQWFQTRKCWGDKACWTLCFITAFASCKLHVWFSLTVRFLYSSPVLAT